MPWEEKVGFWNEAGFHLFLQLQFDFISPFPVYFPDLISLFSSIVMCYCLWNNHLFFDCFPTAHLQCFPVDFCCLSPYAHWMFPTLFPLFCLLLALCWWVVALHVWLFTKVWYFIVHCPYVNNVSLVNCILPCFPFLSCWTINCIDCFHIMLYLSQWFLESL